MNSSMNHPAAPANTVIYRPAMRRPVPNEDTPSAAPKLATASPEAADATTPVESTQAAAPAKRPVLHLRRKHAGHSPQT